MLLPNQLIRALPKPEMSVMYDPSSEATAIFLKLQLWSDLSLMTTISMDRHLRPQLRLRLITALPEGFNLASPAYSIRLI
jgi:hypothetical protein